VAITLTKSYQKISTIALTYGEIRTYAKYTNQDKTTNKTTYYIKSTYYIPTQNNVAFSSASAALDGTAKSYGYTTMYKGETTIQELSRTITHNADGSSPTKKIATSWSASFGGGGNTSADIKMPKIQRLATITNASDFTDEENPYIEFTNPASFKVEPYINFYDNNNKLMLSIKRTSSLYTSPYNWELTDEERNTIRNTLNGQKSYKANYGLNTYSGTTNIGYSSQSKTISFVNAEPTFTSSLEETDTNVISVLGSSVSKIIKNASDIKATIVPTALKGATIKSVEIIHGNSDVVLTASPYELVLTAITDTFKIIVTDSRGYVVDETITKELIDYIPIEISQYSFKRVNPTSSNLYLNASIKYKQQTFDTTENAPTLQWKLGSDGTLKGISDEDYSIDTTNNEITISNLLLENIIPYTQQGKLYLIVNDLLTSDTENQLVLVGIPVFDYGEHDFQVNGDLFIADRNRQNAKSILDFVHPIGSYYETDDLEFNPNVYWGGEWELEEDGTVLVSKSNDSNSKFNVDLGTIVGSETHTLTIAEMPKHRHVIPYSANTNAGYKSVIRSNGTEAEGFSPYQGQDQPHNNVQPSKVVNRWHRIA